MVRLYFAAGVAMVLLSAGCANLPTDPAEQQRLFTALEELSGLDADELTADKREEMRRICGGLDVADLLGYLPEGVPWRVWCAQIWETDKEI